MFQWIKKWMHREEAEERFCSAVIPAAGQSLRMKGENKLLAEVGGMPVIVRTVLAVGESDYISEIVVAVREEDLLTFAELFRAYEVPKPLKIVVGGEDRMASVMAALAECDQKAVYAAVHDGARPLVTREIIDETVKKAFSCSAAAPAVPVKDTIKVAVDHIIKETPQRSTLFAVQTPQVFDIALLRAALQSARAAHVQITDDCSAVERLGKEIYLTEGSYENIKITTPEDLILAEAISESRG